MFKGLQVQRSFSTGAIEISSVLGSILRTGYPLPVETTCISYYHSLEKCYVFVGTMTNIRTLMVPQCALVQGQRLTVRARSMNETVINHRLSDFINKQQGKSLLIEGAFGSDQQASRSTFIKGIPVSVFLSLITHVLQCYELDHDDDHQQLKADFSLTQLFSQDHAQKSMDAIERSL